MAARNRFMITSQRKDSALLFHTVMRVTPIAQQRALVCVCVNPPLDASKACGLNAARQRATSYGSDSKTQEEKPQPGDSKDEALFTGPLWNPQALPVPAHFP